jgi:undecaprenyl diphosphate synthase
MDGNGRWATAKGLPRLQGHLQGVTAVRELIQACPSIGVDTITLFAFAIANWKRDTEEVDGLWTLFQSFIDTDLTSLVEKGVRVVVIGNRDGLPEAVKQSVQKVEAASAMNTTFLLQVALNYDGVDEVVRLIKHAIQHNVSVEEISASYVQTHLDTQAGNDPDVVIRTGMPTPQNGMSVWRSSAFLPIQSAQSVCVSTEVLWPDFTIEHLAEIISFADPEARLFGGQRSLAT